MIKYICSALVVLLLTTSLRGQEMFVHSPDGALNVKLQLTSGQLSYSVQLEKTDMLMRSPLGLLTEQADFTKGLRLRDTSGHRIDEHYEDAKIKHRHVHYRANELVLHLENEDKKKLDVIFRVSDRDVAFRYFVPQVGETANIIVKKEDTGFKFPLHTTTFLSPQATPMIGWMRTKPSYEEEYVPDEAMGTPSKYGVGYTFPALFHVGDQGWVLVSETGTDGQYPATKLGEGTKEGLYQIAFPELAENSGVGSVLPAFSLPGHTPWRTLTVGKTLKPIVETTVPFDVVKPRYEATKDYQFGRATWSWIMWQDNSMNKEDQYTFVDLAADMGYEFTLVDANWDRALGYDGTAALAAYAAKKNVGLFLWYNSNGFWNDAPQTPKNGMSTSLQRRKEMAWMRDIGIKGIKVDFFGGDKQATMQLYEDILTDANDYGLMVIFHGCTLPRGWERMYPNFVGSEAVLASENLVFTQHSNDTEAYNATLHPFIRNAVGSMDFGPVLLNKRHNRENNGGPTRKTSDVFQIGTAVAFQAPVQNFAIAPNNLHDSPDFVIDFMKNVPTTWDETIFLDGYPGKYVVLARRHGDTWYIVGLNAEKTEKSLNLTLPMLKNKEAIHLYDDKDRAAMKKNQRLAKGQTLRVTMQADGGFVLVGQ